MSRRKNLSKSEASASPETTRSTSTTPRADVLTRFSETRKPPLWLGDNPEIPYKAGHMFGSLRLLSPVLVREHSVSAHGKHCVYLRVRCLCTECGTEIQPLWDNVKKGATTRCQACAQKYAAKQRQLSVWGRVPDEIDQWIRCKWFSIRGRCEDPLNRGYRNYGGRGIRLSEEFLNPLAFIDYMRSVGDAGEAFRQKLEIDRIDNERGYERGNLRWATRSEQALNTRATLRVDYGEDKGILFRDFVRKYCSVGLSRALFLHYSGVPLDEIARRKGRGPRGPYVREPRV